MKLFFSPYHFIFGAFKYNEPSIAKHFLIKQVMDSIKKTTEK